MPEVSAPRWNQDAPSAPAPDLVSFSIPTSMGGGFGSGFPPTPHVYPSYHHMDNHGEAAGKWSRHRGRRNWLCAAGAVGNRMFAMSRTDGTGLPRKCQVAGWPQSGESHAALPHARRRRSTYRLLQYKRLAARRCPPQADLASSRRTTWEGASRRTAPNQEREGASRRTAPNRIFVVSGCPASGTWPLSLGPGANARLSP